MAYTVFAEPASTSKATAVETGFIVSGHFYLDLKFASVSCVIQMKLTHQIKPAVVGRQHFQV